MLIRSAIRLAAVAILSDPNTALQSGSCATGFTAAQDRVFDSHSEPLQLLQRSDVELPAISVYTDAEDGDFGAGMSMNFSSHVDLVVHVEMYASMSTDFDTEMLLDTMEEQVRRKLLWDDRLYRQPHIDEQGNVSGFDRLVQRISKYQSTRAMDSERQARIGMRRFSLTVHYVENCLPPEIVVGERMAPATMTCMKAGVQIGRDLTQFNPKFPE
ncbi:hypothetical protein KY49_718 [Burkholderia sp. MSHR3999]|uniref:hypothetical protein n=1 Tax=Burkholderia sp. MSHR3999 TaxID=1542965 RepID=UPI0005ACE354|nr:hypothetical protein [Burkholderia sp. MSHR3999]KIP14980.1 hypothetical protein KY49_718 [Burkholderia sp. MSHR3999]